MVFTYAPDFVIKRKRRARSGADGSTGRTSSGEIQAEDLDVPTWTVLDDRAVGGSSSSDPRRPTPVDPADDDNARVVTVEDFLQWSVQTPPAKRYSRKRRRAKLETLILEDACEDTALLSGCDIQKIKPSLTTRRRRGRKQGSLTERMFTAAALSHADTRQLSSHTVTEGCRVPLKFVGVEQVDNSSPHAVPRNGSIKLVDPREAVEFLDMPSPPLTIPALSSESPITHSARQKRKPVSGWQQWTHVQDYSESLSRCSQYGAPPVVVHDPDRRSVIPFELIPLEDHESSLQTRRLQQMVAGDTSRVACHSMGPSSVVTIPAATISMSLEKQEGKGRNVLDAARQHQGYAATGSPSVQCVGYQSHPTASGKTRVKEFNCLLSCASAATHCAVSAAPNRLGAPDKQNSSEPFLDTLNRFSIPESKTDEHNSTLAMPRMASLSDATLSDARVTADSASASLLTPFGEPATVTAGASSSVPVGGKTRLRPLGSYLDSLRETARTATKLQVAPTQDKLGKCKLEHSRAFRANKNQVRRSSAATQSPQWVAHPYNPVPKRNARDSLSVRPQAMLPVVSRRGRPCGTNRLRGVNQEVLSQAPDAEGTQEQQSLLAMLMEDMEGASLLTTEELASAGDGCSLFDCSMNFFPVG